MWRRWHSIFNHNMKSIWTTFVVDKKSQSAGVAMSSVTSHAGLIVVKDAFPPLHLVLLGDKWGDRQGDVATNVPGQGDIPGCRLWTSHHRAPNVPGASLHEVCTFRMSQLAVRPHRAIELNTLNRKPLFEMWSLCLGCARLGGRGWKRLPRWFVVFSTSKWANSCFKGCQNMNHSLKRGVPIENHKRDQWKKMFIWQDDHWPCIGDQRNQIWVTWMRSVNGVWGLRD